MGKCISQLTKFLARVGVLVGVLVGMSIGALFPVTGTAEALKDPTRPLVYAEPDSLGETDALNLDSILIAGSRKVAVINGESATEGERVAGALVKQIRSGSVDVIFQGEAVTLQLVVPIRTAGKGIGNNAGK